MLRGKRTLWGHMLPNTDTNCDAGAGGAASEEQNGKYKGI